MKVFEKYHLTNGWRGNISAAILLFIFVTLVFAPFAYGDRSLMSSAYDAPSLFLSGGKPDAPLRTLNKLLDPGAAAWQTEPEFILEHEEIAREKHAPLWNPYSGFGQPLAANMQSQVFFPLAWIPVANESPRAYNWFIILRFYFGALFMFLFLRYFVGFAAAIAGAVGFAFTGYFVLYENISHLSVELLTPSVFWAMENLLRKRSAVAVVVLACAVALLIFGGMPESALLAFSFAYLYFIVRLTTDAQARGEWRKIGSYVLAATVLGAGIAACQELPFLEFLKLSTNQHSAGIVGATGQGFSFPVLGSYLAPLIYGPPYNNIFTGNAGFTGITGWWGVAQVFFALITIATVALSRTRHALFALYSATPVYFFAIAAVLLLKRFADPLVNWIGFLPGFNLVNFPKYEEALIGFCVAVLAAFGVNELALGRVRPLVAWIATVAPLVFLTAIAALQKPAFADLIARQRWYLGFLGAALAVLAALTALTWIACSSRGRKFIPLIAALSVAVVFAEAAGSYIVPLWYIVIEEPPLTRAPIYGNAYVEFLRSQTARDRSRFYGEDYLLYPEWSSAFGIGDVRDINALYDFRYLTFVRAFIPARGDEQLVDRFTGREPDDFLSARERRFLTLSSVQFVGTQRPLAGGDSLLGRALLAQPKDVGANLYLGSYTIGGTKRVAVVMPPPRSLYPVSVSVPQAARRLNYAIGMDPAIWSDRAPTCGDGVTFAIDVRDAAGKTTPLVRRYIDPKHRERDRRWFDLSAPVSRWAGQGVQLLFSTMAGPSGKTCDDWALWSNVEFDATPRSPFTLAYDAPDAKIYRFADALPRLAIYSSVLSAKRDDDALAIISDPAFDPFQDAVVVGAPPQNFANVSATRVAAGRIERYTSQSVQATVDTPRPVLAVLNDTFYPGWVASIDGRDVEIVQANYMFRGVWVPPGRHVLEFTYRPRSFIIGLLITCVSLCVAVLIVARRLLRGKLKRAGIA